MDLFSYFYNYNHSETCFEKRKLKRLGDAKELENNKELLIKLIDHLDKCHINELNESIFGDLHGFQLGLSYGLD